MQILWWSAARAQIVDDEEKVWAHLSRVNPMSDDAQVLRDDLARVSGDGRIAAWSGWAGEGDPALGQFEPDPSVWMPAGRERLDGFLGAAAEFARGSGAQIVWRPHAATGLSDLPGCVALANGSRDTGFGLLADPVGLLTPETLKDAEDHLKRAGAVFAAVEGVEGLVLTGARADGGAMSAAPIGEGDVPLAMLLGACGELLNGRLPVILLDEDRERQLALLRLAGAAVAGG